MNQYNKTMELYLNLSGVGRYVSDGYRISVVKLVNTLLVG